MLGCASIVAAISNTALDRGADTGHKAPLNKWGCATLTETETQTQEKKRLSTSGAVQHLQRQRRRHSTQSASQQVGLHNTYRDRDADTGHKAPLNKWSCTSLTETETQTQDTKRLSTSGAAHHLQRQRRRHRTQSASQQVELHNTYRHKPVRTPQGSACSVWRPLCWKKQRELNSVGHLKIFLQARIEKAKHRNTKQEAIMTFGLDKRNSHLFRCAV